MLRKFGAVALAAAILASTGTVALADQAALAPGKPAGVHDAAFRAPKWIWIAGVGFVALGTCLVACGSGNGHSGGSTTTTHL